MYYIKEEKAKDIRNKYKQKYLADTLGRSQCYVSLLLSRKLGCPKLTAYAFTKMLDSEAEILDYFEVE